MSRFSQVFPQKQGAGRVKDAGLIPDKISMVQQRSLQSKIKAVVAQSILTSATLFYAPMVLAQAGIDPSSALLLNTGSRTQERANADKPANDGRLDSGRYTVRPRDRGNERPAATPAPKKQTGTSSSTQATQEAAVVVPTTTTTVVVPVNEQGTVVINNSEKAAEPGETVILDSRGGTLLEIAIGTGYLYENSSSSYSYRRYSTAAPAYAIEARAWLSSEFGVGGSYLSSMGATVGDGGSDSSATRADTTAGLFLRNSISREKDLTLGIEFVNFQFRVPGDSVNRVKTESSGVRLSVRGDWPDFRIGFSIAPKLQHEESSPSAGVRSGSSAETYRVGFMLERRWAFDSSNTLFLRLQHDVEQNSFSGSTSSPDQVTGATPNGVGVTQGTTVIQFGYDWGQ